MGPLQTYYYLTLLGVVFLVLALIFVAVGLGQLRRLFQERDDRLVAWLVTGAIVLVFLFMTVASIGVIVGLTSSGSQS
jgi:hypothetical protein